MNVHDWTKQVIKQDEIDRYLVDGKDFIERAAISHDLQESNSEDKGRINAILDKSLSIELLSPSECATLLNVKDPQTLEQMKEVALQVKKKVYDNRIVLFAPLYCSNKCVNGCKYCGFRSDNCQEKRHVLSMDEIKQECEALIDEGHKRIIAVYGEHPESDANYIAESMGRIYATLRKTPSENGFNSIRRVNVNAAPMAVEDLKKLWRAGIGTYQVFQETYNRPRYEELHPQNTIKGDYRWRLYAMHRAMEAGIDDVAIGALFGLYDWKYEVMGLLHHAHDLERCFGIGPHTISFPRMQPALGSFLSENSPYLVNDENFKHLITVLRLAVPYTGLIVTARESAELRREVLSLGCTQTDASTKIGVGAYTKGKLQEDNLDKVQFLLGDQRPIEEVVKELTKDGYITSFCTAGYRCGRTGDKIMSLLEKGIEGKFCKLNAVLTFQEYLNDYASPETKVLGEALIKKELDEIQATAFYKDKKLLPTFLSYFSRIENGERDLYM